MSKTQASGPPTLVTGWDVTLVDQVAGVCIGNDHQRYVFLCAAKRGVDGVPGGGDCRPLSRAGLHCPLCVAKVSFQDLNFVSL